MESAAKVIYVLASSSLWLAGSGLVLWLYLRSRQRLSPGTRAVASMLIVLQGWIWVGIPVRLNIPAQIYPAWIAPQLIGIPVQKAAAIDAAEVAMPPASLRLSAGAGESAPIDAAEAATPLQFRLRSFDLLLSFAASSMPYVMPMAVASAAAIWMAGIAIILWRSICAFVALSRMVHALPRAPAEWQNELSALCRKQSIGSNLVLKISHVASPMLVQTWGSVSIVVPAWLWESCTAEQRRSILLHELAHYRRGDVWRQLAMRLLVLPHWFNPVAWWAARQFEAASEAACDEAACGDDPRVAISYSKALLVLNETILNERIGIRYAHALAISGSSLTERIRRVLHPEFQKESLMSKFLILSAMIVLTGLAAIRIHAADQQAPAKKETAKNEPAGSNAVSLLPNGGFEESQEESGEPRSWYATRIPYPMDEKGKRAGPVLAGHYLMSTSPKLAHGGKRCVIVEIGDDHPDLPVAYNWTTEVQGWKAGETYELSGWIKVENAKEPAFIMVQCWDKSEDRKSRRMIGGAGTEKDFPVKGDTEWTKVTTRFTVPEGTGSLRLRAGLSSKGNRGAKAWLDDLALVKVAN